MLLAGGEDGRRGVDAYTLCWYTVRYWHSICCSANHTWCQRIVLCACYTVSGTSLAYGALWSAGLS
eukprot:37296-Rhodomonas_salina.1